MGWTAPRDWVTGEVVTAALMNTHVRDNLRYLKGLDGDITFEDDILTSSNVDGVDLSAHKAGTAVAQHTGGAGNHTHQSAGAQGGQLDHGAALTGLTDDDHTQYLLESTLTTNGDIYIRSGGAVIRLAIGNANEVLTVSGAMPVWAVKTITATEAIAPTYGLTAETTWQTLASFAIPSTAREVEAWIGGAVANYAGALQIVYNSLTKASVTVVNDGTHYGCHWSGDGVGTEQTLSLQYRQTDPGGSIRAIGGGYYYT